MTTWIRRSACALAWVLVLCATRAQSWTAGQYEWLARFNQERERAGAPPFRLVPVLAQLAQQEAEEMARGARRSPSTQAISERLRRVGYSARDWRHYVLRSEMVPEAALVALKARVDGRFKDLGIGIADAADGRTLYVFLFGWHQGDYFASATARLADRARIEAEMLARVNDARRREGLRPVALSPLLDRVAQEHAEDMLARSYFGHMTPEGWGPSERARAGGYRSGVSENLVEQRFSAEEALDAWMGSPGHRRNILDPGCREMGMGLAVGAGYEAAPGGYRVIWVQSCGSGDDGAETRRLSP